MSNIFIVIEISGLQQFLVVEAPMANEMIKSCERSINSTIKADLKIHGPFLVFNVHADLDNSAAVIEASEKLYEIINGYKEEIHEYSMMLLYRRISDFQKLITELKQTYFSVALDDILLIENKIVTSAGLSLKNNSVKGFQEIKIDDQKLLVSKKNTLKQFIDQDEVDRLVRVLVPEIESSETQHKFIIQGRSELVIRLNLEEALRIASGENKYSSAVYIDFLEDETNAIMPFIRSIDRQLMPIVDDNLEGIELKTWLAGKKKLVHVSSDYPEEYFFSVYCLYLKGIMKFFHESLQPAVLVFSGLSIGCEACINYAERIITCIEGISWPDVFFIDSSEEGAQLEYETIDFFKDVITIKCCDRVLPPAFPVKLNYLNSRILYVISLTEGLFERHILDDFLINLGFNKSEISMGITTLESEGLIINRRYIRVIDKNQKNTAVMIKEREQNFHSLAEFINKNLHTNLITDFGRAAKKLIGLSADPLVDTAIFNCLTSMLDLGNSSFVLNYISENSKFNDELSDALELRSFLIENDKEACLKVLEKRSEKLESPCNMNEALLMLEYARYYHAMNDFKRALDCIKKVLIFLQEGDFPSLEGVAFTELGFLMLCKGRLLESSEYMNLAVEKLLGTGDSFNLMKAYLYTAIQQYLWGAIDSSIESNSKALEIAEANGFEEWQFFIEFFDCRLMFELGRYYDAEKMLSECLLRTEIYQDDKRKKIFSAWIARACIYQGKIYRGISMLLSLNEDPEVLFFLAEAYYFNGNMEKAIESIEKAESDDSYFSLGFMSLDHISWKNGFTSVEARILRSKKGTGVLLHNIRALHAFLLGMTGNREYGSEILFSLTRDEKISENDPFNRLYFYFYCQLLESRKNTEMIDKLTLISKALKYLQQTSSRISTPSIRQQFMLKNYWNSRLVAEAQREKLI